MDTDAPPTLADVPAAAAEAAREPTCVPALDYVLGGGLCCGFPLLLEDGTAGVHERLAVKVAELSGHGLVLVQSQGAAGAARWFEECHVDLDCLEITTDEARLASRYLPPVVVVLNPTVELATRVVEVARSDAGAETRFVLTSGSRAGGTKLRYQCDAVVQMEPYAQDRTPCWRLEVLKHRRGDATRTAVVRFNMRSFMWLRGYRNE